VSDLKHIGIVLFCIPIICAVWVAYDKLAYRAVTPDEKGRIMITPGLVSILLGVMSAAFALLFTSMTLAAIFNPIDDRLFFLLLGPPLAALMSFGAVIIFWTRLRVSSEKVEYRGAKGWKSYLWEDVQGVDSHAGLGPRLRVKDLRPLYFWPYGYGANEVRNMFIEHDKFFSLT